MLPAISIVALHGMKSDVLVGHLTREYFHLLFLRQRKEALRLIHDFICVFLIDALGMPGQHDSGELLEMRNSHMIYQVKEADIPRRFSNLFSYGLPVF